MAWLPLLPEPTGVEREAAAGRRTHGLGDVVGRAGGTGLGGRPLQMKRDAGSPGRRAPADFYLLPRAEWSAERTRAEAQAQRAVLPPLEATVHVCWGRGPAPVRLGSQDEGLPTPRGPAHRALSFPPVPDSALRWSIRRAGRVLGSRVEGGARRAGGAQAPGFPFLPPRRPSEVQKEAHCLPGNTFLGAE